VGGDRSKNPKVTRTGGKKCHKVTHFGNKSLGWSIRREKTRSGLIYAGCQFIIAVSGNRRDERGKVVDLAKGNQMKWLAEVYRGLMKTGGEKLN